MSARASLLIAVLTAGFIAANAWADDSILYSKHDLSVTGPGPVRALTESEVCIFCHTPHNASPAAPLWNRHNPRTHYRIYNSSTTDARISQPGGPSKLCLSCHDGSIALGMVLSQSEPILMNQPFIPTGPSNLTNDLSDDHPIGFRYDRALFNRDPQLRSPDLIDSRIKLGPRGEVECIACHDPHNNELGDFLRLPTREGILCNTCHRMAGWETSAHALATKFVPATLTRGEPIEFGATMADAACAARHVSHGADERERLLRDRSYDLCISCHDGVTAVDVGRINGMRSGHRPERFRNIHDPAEDIRNMRYHVDCADCHNPHAVRANAAALSPQLAAIQGPQYMPTMEEVSGVSLSGVPLDDARLYYEVCFKCHSDNPVPPSRQRINRQRDDFGNIRRQFQPTAASMHPVTTPIGSRGNDNPSLLAEVRTRPYIGCQDCHNNPDARQLGGSTANGPHGSPFPWLLVDRYETADFTLESSQSYALCYRCHDRQSILNDESFSFHNVHIVRGRTPCSACHAPHGVSGSAANHSHLINFDLAIVRGQRLFVDQGRFAGSCTLVCHGVNHVNFQYSR